MTADRDLGRRLAAHFSDEAPRLAPDWVLPSALTTIESTRQRRGFLAPWRFTPMPTYAKLGATAAAAVAVVAVVVLQLTPPMTPAATPVAPTPSTSASTPPTSGAYAVPPLARTFTSSIFGLRITYPDGWKATAGLVPWRFEGTSYREPLGDLIEDPARENLFIKMASQPLGATSFDQWAPIVLAGRGCSGSGTPVTIDGAQGRIDASPSCLTAVVASGGRGYLIGAHWNSDLSELRSIDWGSWFMEVVAGVHLVPADAADAVVDLAAQNISYSTKVLAAPAGVSFVIRFRNTESAEIPHTVDIRRIDGTTDVQRQEPITGGQVAAFRYDPLPAGDYVFTCSVHPIPAMTGTLQVR